MSRISMSFFVLVGMSLGVQAQSIKAELIRDESSITYRLVHLLHTVEAVSKDVTCRIEVDATNKELKAVSAQVDVSTFDSGNSNRDSHAMEVIDALTYPYATFSSTSITQSGDSLKVAGQLMFHGVAKEVVLFGTTKWVRNKLEVQGRFEISLTAFQVERPSLLMVPVDDALKFTLKASFIL